MVKTNCCTHTLDGTTDTILFPEDQTSVAPPVLQASTAPASDAPPQFIHAKKGWPTLFQNLLHDKVSFHLRIGGPVLDPPLQNLKLRCLEGGRCGTTGPCILNRKQFAIASTLSQDVGSICRCLHSEIKSFTQSQMADHKQN